ncbi:MAG: transglycosylase SLT domain-containing protein [Thermodesulfobacteriota bacterium]
MLFDRKIVLHCLAGLIAASVLVLTVSSCSHQRAESAGLPADTFLQGPAVDGFGAAVRSLKLGRKGQARSLLARVRRADPGTVWEARASFLLGVLAVEDGDPGAGAYLDDARGIGGIPDYVAFYRARAYALAAEPGQAVAAFNSLISRYPSSALVPEASYLRALSVMEDGRVARGLAALTGFVASWPESPLVPEALLRSAEASVMLGRTSEAASTVKKILVRYPADAVAEGALALYAALAPEGGGPAFTPAERYARARGFFDNARFEEAVGELAPLVKAPGGGLYDRAVIKTAVSMVRLKEYERAGALLSGYLGGSYAPPPETEPDALYWSALVSLRQSSEKALLKALKRLSERYPGSIERARALVFLARHYAGRSMAAKAIDAYKKVSEGFPGTASAQEAVWSTGWLYYRSGRFDKAYKVFSAAGAPEPARFLYWSGRSAERMGSAPEAVHRYRLLCASHASDYYCRMAEKRLRALDPVAADVKAASSGAGTRPAFAKVLPSTARASGVFIDPHYLAAKELLTLGMDGRAAREIALLTRAYSREPGALVELAGLFYEAGDFYSAFRVYYSHLAGLDSLSADLSVLSFPPRLVELVRRKAPDSVDPYLVAAVMREESSFNPNAVSTTGALGLMQIMPSTGRYIAGKLGRTLDDERELLDPDVNIRLGSWYLAHLARRFDGDLVLTIASYNAGPSAVKRWTVELPAELDEFIESIPYPETRRYAKKVLKSYAGFLRTDGVETTGLFGRPAFGTSTKPANDRLGGAGPEAGPANGKES